MKKLKILTQATRISDLNDQFDDDDGTLELRKERIENKLRHQSAY